MQVEVYNGQGCGVGVPLSLDSSARSGVGVAVLPKRRTPHRPYLFSQLYRI